MAQKKVILKDGSNELLPKTLASMVFTEAGQTVEEALQNAGGGSSSGGGTGNVNVTNASGLKKDNYYAFKPSANGSVEGTFSTIPDASESKAGLMSSPTYEKLGKMKSVIALPVSVLEYNAETTSETIESMLQTAFGTTTGNVAVLFLYIAASLRGEYNSVFPKFYIGDLECMLGGNAVATSQATLEFSYVDGGKLHTMAITMVVSGESDSQTYTYSAKVLESGDDTYYLPDDVRNLDSSNTAAEVFAALGGADGYTALREAIAAKKKIYLPSTGLFLYSTPVSACITLSDVTLSYNKVALLADDITIIVITCNGSESTTSIKQYYPAGYSLKPALYSLTTSSSSDDISAAVGGESGLKEIIQAVKDGNRLVIRGTMEGGEDGVSLSTDVVMNVYAEKENGDLSIGYSLFGMVQGSGYYGGSFYYLQYIKSSNTFSIKKLDI